MTYYFSMLHALDSRKNFETDDIVCDFTDKYNFGTGINQFYRKDNIAENGFIFPDGSLRFAFFIKRNNFMKKLQISQTQITELNKQKVTMQKEKETMQKQMALLKQENEAMKADLAKMKAKVERVKKIAPQEKLRTQSVCTKTAESNSSELACKDKKRAKSFSQVKRINQDKL